MSILGTALGALGHIGLGVASSAIGAGSQVFQDYLNNEVSGHYYRKLTDWNYRRQLMYQLEAARRMPSAQVQGLRDAGLNPILAAQDLGASGGSFSGSTFSASGDSSGMDASNASSVLLAPFMAIADLKQKQANVDATKANAEALRTNANTNQWQIYDRKAMSQFGFDKLFGVKFGDVNSVRVNRLTGEVRDFSTNRMLVPPSNTMSYGSNVPSNNGGLNSRFDQMLDGLRPETKQTPQRVEGLDSNSSYINNYIHNIYHNPYGT